MLFCVIFLGSSLDVIILLFNFSSNTILELLKLYSVIKFTSFLLLTVVDIGFIKTLL